MAISILLGLVFAAGLFLVFRGLDRSGAVADDQARWSAGFRRLLDALGGPLQVVLRFRPEAGDGVLAQRREVLLVTAPHHRSSLVAGLAGLGLAVRDGASAGHPDPCGEGGPRPFALRAGGARR